MHKADLSADPLVQFDHWYQHAINEGQRVPDAMTLATASKDGKPSARIVLHKGIRDGCFMFVTNFTSRKASELDDNPQACLLFFWPVLEQQIRVEGSVTRASHQLSSEYFHSRPRGSQLGAWASPQSQVIPNREFLEQRQQKVTKLYQESEVPCPDFWGAYLLNPTTIEFWASSEHRLHDRFRYTKLKNAWKIERLAP